MHPAIPRYFTVHARKGIKAVVSSRGYEDLRTPSMRRAKELWEGGSPYFQITAEGARTLYGKHTPDDRVPLLQYCSTPDEVAAILAAGRRNQALGKAADERLRQLGHMPAGADHASVATPPSDKEGV